MRRILIIEDSQETLESLKDEFENADYETICYHDNNSVQKALENDIPFDAVILDWYFVLPESSKLSREILKKLKHKCFVPVFVYTGHLEDFNNQTEDELGYPQNMITGFDKTIGEAELNKQIQKLINNNLAYKLALTYRESLKSHLERLFFELNDFQSSDLAKILKTIYGNGENIDWNNDIIITLLHRSLVSDDTFTKEVSEILKKVSDTTTSNNKEINRKIISRILYHYGKSDYIRNGDIVSVKNSYGTIISYGIVVTPDCDLEQKKTQFIDIIKIIEIDDIKIGLTNGQKENILKYNHDSFFPLPAIYVNGKLNDFVAILKSHFLIQEKEITAGTKFPSASKRHLYSHTFTLNGQNVKLEYICSKVNPYRAEFLHKLHSHNSRVGIPDIKNLL